jgi:hypothetical protein
MKLIAACMGEAGNSEDVKGFEVYLSSNQGSSGLSLSVVIYLMAASDYRHHRLKY